MKDGTTWHYDIFLCNKHHLSFVINKVKMTYKRRKNVHSNGMKKGAKTKRKTKDLDEIDNDLKEENARKLLNQEVDFDKPGAAQYYCVHCSRYFINDKALEDHFTTKVHKRRLKALEDEPYTIEESKRAAGHGNWTEPKKRKIETLPRDAFIHMDIEPPAKIQKAT